MDKENANKRKLTISTSEEEEEDVEEESESEPEVDCDKWDDDCKIVKTEPKHSVQGYHLMPTCSRNPDENPHKKIKLAPEIRKSLLDVSYKSEFAKSWLKGSEFLRNGTDLVTSPFKVCVVDNFLDNANILGDVRQEFNDVDWNLRSMDLYEFSQSKDLKYLDEHEYITSVYKFLENDVMKWVAEVTGLKLTHISATCSLYNNTDYLLVHDDQRGDRMVAFILYLTNPEGWDENKGGALQLLNKNEDGHPLKVVRNIYPTNNQFVFFQVTNDSYHQVAEVTSFGDTRLSINGWFHTESPPVYESPQFQPYPEGLYGDKIYKQINFDSELSSWICDEYLESDITEDIQEYFEQHSEISLKNFLKQESFNEISLILTSDSLSWVKVGPPNRYCYEVAKTNDLPSVLQRFLQLFQSKQMFTLLQSFTGLEFTEETSSVKFELQKWTPGCYALLGDYDWYDKKQLDLVLYFGCKNNTDVIGARTLYVTLDEEIQDALITLEPEENNLNLIYRDTARFTKYFSKLSRCGCFYTLICSYSE
ncbi:hypothetical protein Zmor_025502 [Zophobas morio]|uniref:uS12 prolyl 3-hydroxylase n=1 Tax=Zophobas morio TaxID=2755281 RepID=A0AA38HRS3_9CUCU|nr:hypothetical protein Zmor_025502 [Zophobas morio]